MCSLYRKLTEIDQCVTIIWPLTDAYGAPIDLFDSILYLCTSLQAVNLLVERGASCHTIDNSGRNPLYSACK